MDVQVTQSLNEESDDRTKANNASNIRVTKVSTFENDQKPILIRPFNDTCMIQEYGHKLKIMSNDGEVKKTFIFQSDIRGFRQTLDRRVLVCYRNNAKVKQMRDIVIDFISTDPLYPLDVFTTDKGDNLVTVCNSPGFDCSVKPESGHGALVVYGPNGKEKMRVTGDTSGHNMFIFPSKVDVAPDGTVAVLNEESNDASHLVLLSPYLSLQLRIMGRGVVIPGGEKLHNLADCKKCFFKDFVFTKSSLLIVAEHTEMSISLVTTDGEFLRVLTTLDNPACSLAIDSGRHLWVGMENKRVDIFKAK